MKVILFNIAFTFLFLVVGDFALLFIESKTDTESKMKLYSILQNEQSRKFQEDVPQRAEAVKAGYAPIILPSYYEAYAALKKLAVQKKVVPLGAQPDKEVYFCNEGYGLVKYKTDRYGFRNENAMWDKPEIDLLLIGDSFTHGACVEKKESIQGQLLENFDVINLGSASNAAIHYAALLKDIPNHIKAKNIVLIFYTNDFQDTGKESLFYKAYFEQNLPYLVKDKNGKLVVNKTIIDLFRDSESIIRGFLVGDKTEEKSRKGAAYFQGKIDKLNQITTGSITEKISKPENLLHHLKLTTIRERLSDLINKKEDPEAAKKLLEHTNRWDYFSTKLALDLLIKTCKARNCTPHVVILPTSRSRPEDRTDHFNNFVMGELKKKKISHINIAADHLFEKDDFNAIRGPHFSPKAYRYIAGKIRNMINKSDR